MDSGRLFVAIAWSIVEKNQGIIQVASEPGRGRVFTIRLLAAPGEGTPA
jgi:signal transduction histidine kinase